MMWFGGNPVMLAITGLMTRTITTITTIMMTTEAASARQRELILFACYSSQRCPDAWLEGAANRYQ
jgi:hypothetical protein